MKKLVPGICITLFLLVTSCRSDRKVINQESLLREMGAREQLTYFPSPAFRHLQFSSYNRLSVSPADSAWFANQDMSHFIRIDSIDGRREFVMLDTDGPGVVVRWWMTFYKAQEGTIRVYLDNANEPLLRGRPDSLLSGSMLAGYPYAASVQKNAERGEAGRDYDHNLYYPIPFKEHCKITYECDSLKFLYDYEGTAVPQGYWFPDVFYNIGYRLYNTNAPVESFSTLKQQKCKRVEDETGVKLLDGSKLPGEEKSAYSVILPGDSLVTVMDEKSSAVNRITLFLESVNLTQALRSVVMELWFDNHRTVWVPVGEFFGCGYSLNPHRNWMNSSDGKGSMQSLWFMPYKKSCRIVFRNFSGQEVKMKCGILIAPYQWTKESMYFASAWHEYWHINSRDSSNRPFDLNFIHIQGKGVYAGDQISLYNPTWYWWGEGDEKIFVDGEKFPSIFGTGSEDYYGYSFGRTEPFSHPFICQPVGKGNMGSGPVVNTRIRSLDAIPFHSSIDANIELWHWAKVRMNYALTSYFYVQWPYTVNVLPDPESVKRKVALHGDDLK
ncbi:MAG: glycoside hydrolase family 172 protein [Bacteroidales bacterium]